MAKWTSNLMFFLAAVGSAVGLGNIWRFPYMLKEYGWAFLILYLLFNLVVGLPLLYLELDAGRRKGHVGAFLKRAKFLVLPAFLMGVLIVSYYAVVSSWVASALFTQYNNSTANLVSLVLLYAAAVFTLHAGVKKGIEQVVSVLMPLLFLSLLGLVVFALWHGHGFTLSAGEWTQAWAPALSQSLFSIGIGVGVMLTYGSYLARRTPIKETVLTVVSDALVALLAAFVILSFGVDAQGPTLAFEALPAVFAVLPFGRLAYGAFLFLLLAAAFTSFISMLDVIKEAFPKFWWAVFFLSLVFWLRPDWIGLADDLIVGRFLPLVALLFFLEISDFRPTPIYWPGLTALALTAFFH